MKNEKLNNCSNEVEETGSLFEKAENLKNQGMYDKAVDILYKIDSYNSIEIAGDINLQRSKENEAISDYSLSICKGGKESYYKMGIYYFFY
jgi:hypothetical protein